MTRPGWPEVAVGLAVVAGIGYGGASQLFRVGLDPVAFGLILAALSGIAGLAGFAAAASLRIRSLAVFGVRRTTKRWLWIGVAVGIAAFFLKGLATIAYIHLTGDSANVQHVYATGGSDGVVSLVTATLLIAVLTPVSEELLFRGVVANALLRCGPVVGVIGSATIFALMHGINIVLPAAFVAGLATGEVFRRSGSVWPAIVVHVVFNLPTVPVMVMAGMTQ
jgi:hypothetical protein